MNISSYTRIFIFCIKKYVMVVFWKGLQWNIGILKREQLFHLCQSCIAAGGWWGSKFLKLILKLVILLCHQCFYGSTVPELVWKLELLKSLFWWMVKMNILSILDNKPCGLWMNRILEKVGFLWEPASCPKQGPLKSWFKLFMALSQMLDEALVPLSL